MNKYIIIGLCVLCLIAYSNSLTKRFVLEDKILIAKNPFIKSLKLFPEIFKKGTYEHTAGKEPFDLMYRPIQTLSYSLDYRVWKLKPFGFHLSNILLHLFNSILIYYLLLRIPLSRKSSGIAAALFLAHPVHNTAVSYISGRADLLSCFFMLISILLFLGFIKKKKLVLYLLSLVAALLALLSRENAAILFLLIALIVFIEKPGRKYYYAVLGFLGLNLCLFVIRVCLFGYQGGLLHDSILGLPLRLLNFLNIVFRYILLLFFPFDLHLCRATPFLHSFFSYKAALILLFTIISAILLLRLRMSKAVKFCLFWFLVGLTPVFLYLDAYPFRGGAMVAEHWLYFPSIGFFASLGYGLGNSRRLGLVISIVLILYFAGLTFYNNRFWKSDIVADKHLLKYFPPNSPNRRLIIEDYLEAGLYNEALSEINDLELVYKGNPFIYLLKGDYYYHSKNPQAAIDNYDLILFKSYVTSYRLGACYKMLKKHEEALISSLASYKMNPYFVPNLVLLGELYIEKKDFKEADQYFKMALELDPDNPYLKEKIKNAK